MTVHQTVPKGWSLMGKSGAMDGKIFSLEITNVSIGTDPTTCNIVYPANTLGIAQLHCQLIWKNDGWLVVSFGDTGTWLNDNLLKNGQAVSLNPGDTLSLANSGNNFIMKYNLVLEPHTDNSASDSSERSVTPSTHSSPTNEYDTWENIKEKFFNYEGRLNRKPFILRVLVICILSGIIGCIVNEIFNASIRDQACFLLTLPLSVSGVMLTIRRLHDTDHSGWWWFTGLIPFLNFYTIYLVYFKRGTSGDNRFGADPLA